MISLTVFVKLPIGLILKLLVMDLKTLILAEDRLSTELGDIFGGTSAIDPEINCNQDGVVYPSQPTEQEPENCHMVL